VSQPRFIHLDSAGGWDALLAQVPSAAGVGQFLVEGGKSLLIGRASNLKRWAASHLGATPSAKGARPRTDLRPLARGLRLARSTSAFHQLWLFERLMATQLALSKRRDLKPPAYLHLDPGERFPRLSVRSSPANDSQLFGPFRDNQGALRVAAAVAKRFRLRPCDLGFEPHPELPLGLRCIHAQVASCAAPCLMRVSEAEYRARAEQAAELLANPDCREEEWGSLLPPWVGAPEARGLVVEPVGSRLEVYPILGGAVLDSEIRGLVASELGECLGRTVWALPKDAGDDRPWLQPWLRARKRSGLFLPLAEGAGPAADADRVLSALSGAPVVPATE